MLAQPANFLVLDEPTNHLDLPSREALEAALEAFAGTVLVVSHDRYFASRVATHVLEVPGDATLRPFAGDFLAYEAACTAAANVAQKHGPAATNSTGAASATHLRSASPAPSAPPGEHTARSAPESADDNGGKASYAAGKQTRRAEAKRRRDVAQVEADVARCEDRVREVDAALCDPATFADAARCAALLAEREELTDQRLPSLLARWEALHAQDAPA